MSQADKFAAASVPTLVLQPCGTCATPFKCTTTERCRPRDHRPAIAAIMHDVRQLARDTRDHAGESTGNLVVLQQKIEDAIGALVGLPRVLPELPGIEPHA